MPAYRCADADEIVRTVAEAEARGESVVQVVCAPVLDPDPSPPAATAAARYASVSVGFVVVTRERGL